jgi:hypothetical protein
MAWFMPTVWRFDGLRVVIYPNDHRPRYGFDARTLTRIVDELRRVLRDLCVQWRTFHGDY